MRSVVVLLAGDSGDGIQLLGGQIVRAAAQSGRDVRTLSDFPAEIRAPQGTVSGVSGFQFRIASDAIHDPGARADCLVAFNAAAYTKYAGQLKPGGLLLAATEGFDARSLALAKLPADADLLASARERFRVLEVPVKDLTLGALAEVSLGQRDKMRARNMLVLGILTWMYSMPAADLEIELRALFRGDETNILAYKAGLNFAETLEVQDYRVELEQQGVERGTFKTINGSHAVALGLAAAAHQLGRPMLYSSYPITPASDILHELAKLQPEYVTVFQAEDEIAAVTSALGASFAGGIGVTASSGPGLSLKAEGLGLAVMTELPLVLIDVQRGGPSTGLPTKTEQSDLTQALHGRHGEAPLPVLAARSAADAFDTTLLAVKIAVECMTPVIVLSDAYIAGSAQPWRIPDIGELPSITPPRGSAGEEPYARDAHGVRPWVTPGTPGGAHRIGGLEGEVGTGRISYEPANHQAMVTARAAKVQAASRLYGPLEVVQRCPEADTLVLAWGSTYGAVRSDVERRAAAGQNVDYIHLRHMHPLHPDLKATAERYRRVVVVEMNEGQLAHHLQGEWACRVESVCKTTGQPFTTEELAELWN
ncbi:MAG: 2-oxoacid:acceptor oxidoreductase subunit alpha [Schleiferiaceae bacterium]|nr:2-oxoacid:acceptor oxidoreductase subunit alpha [Schleiferiaceae bacterium]MDP4833608.1 2-oxoacid:acceptor oxidoreductase subunit alpha [Schleiferiaceae bacterium]